MKDIIMAGIITDLKYQKRDKNLVSIFIDGEYSFSVPLLKASHLETGKELAQAEILFYQKENDHRIAYNQSINYLSRSPRSKMEISQYLKRKGHSMGLISKIVTMLKEKKYIDDEEYARLFVENRERFRPRSKYALGVELRQKGIDAEIIAKLTGSLDESVSAWNSVERKVYRWKDLPKEKFKHKLMGFLVRRGFNYEISKMIYEKALESIRTNNSHEDTKY